MPIPRVFTIHGFIHADTAVAGGRFARLRSALWRAVETRGWADQPHIIAISPYVRERLVAGRGPVIHDIENPIAREFFAVERADAGNVVFTAGAIGRRKNALALVDALARLRDRGIDARLRIAGHVAEPAYAARLEEAIRARRLADRVDLVGPLDTPGILGELRSASVFALASLEENSPLGIQEAMAAGVPVVTSNRCGMPYLVRDGESGYLIDPTRGEEIADRLARLLQDPRLRQRQGAHAAAAARDRFHPDDVARRTREVYRRAARAS